jgi:endonuclease/exonuclease/phosphatase family metal-dependent hydrolase
MLVAGTWNLENLFRPGGDFGPTDTATYQAKLAALAATINTQAPDVLGVQEVGQPEALADLVALLNGTWHTALSQHFDPHHPIRVAVISRHPLTVIADTAAFPTQLSAVQDGDEPGDTATAMGRGTLAVTLQPAAGVDVTFAVAHLKSKLLSYPGTGGTTRFTPHDEGERARYAAYALYRRTAEAVTARATIDQLLGNHGDQINLIVVGDLNDEPQAATTQILYGPPGSQIGTTGYQRPDHGDLTRLWNLAPLIPETERFSRIYQGQHELIDHILVSRALVTHVTEVHTVQDRPLPSIGDNPGARRTARDSDHSPVIAHIDR